MIEKEKNLKNKKTKQHFETEIIIVLLITLLLYKYMGQNIPALMETMRLILSKKIILENLLINKIQLQN